MTISAFPKIFPIGSPHIPHLLHDEVEVTEKIDGSQFVFGVVGGELQIRSKGAYIVPEAPNSMFKEGVDYVVSIAHMLPNNHVFYGEYLQKPKHNVLAYDKIPCNHIALFAVSTVDGKFFDRWDEINWFAQYIGVSTVPLLYKGKVSDAEQLSNLLDTVSILGGQKIEGIVVKNYTPFLLGGQVINVTSGKYVSEAFKEVHRKEWSREHTSGGKWQTFCAMYNSEARWHKAIQHLAEKGELESTPRDIGKLIKEIQDDITAEEKQTIMEMLWRLHKDDVMRQAIRGFPEWYKQELMKGAFDG